MHHVAHRCLKLPTTVSLAERRHSQPACLRRLLCARAQDAHNASSSVSSYEREAQREGL